METRSRLVLYPWMAVECQESTTAEAPPERTKGPSPTHGFPSPEFQTQEEEFPQNLTANISGKSGVWVRQKEPKTPDASLKGPAHRLTHSQTHFLGSSGGSTARWGTRDL